MLSEADGLFLLKLARDTIEKFVKNEKIEKPDEYPECCDEKHGLFCTIYKYEVKTDAKGVRHLRGCIGIPYPVMPLIKAVMSAAVSSCGEDPRFRPVREAELKDIKIEISVLTEPELIEVQKPEEYLEKIKTGEDGLIIEYGPYSGLLLPQVATEYNWDAETFLNYLCMKAGLSPGMWREPNVKLQKFQAQIFREK